VKETPLLLCGEMVRALLAGRKWMTRRVVKPQPPADCCAWGGWVLSSTCRGDEGKASWHDTPDTVLIKKSHRVRCPYGQPGDRLWMRETWQQVWANTAREEDDDSKRIPDFWTRPKTPAWGTGENYWIYRADGEPPKDPKVGKLCWQPSIFMPRKACRIVRELVAVRVERVQDISAEDCIAEGLGTTLREHDAVVDLRRQYQELWDRLNAKRGFPWSSNPWVWVLEWKRENTDGH